MTPTPYIMWPIELKVGNKADDAQGTGTTGNAPKRPKPPKRIAKDAQTQVLQNKVFLIDKPAGISSFDVIRRLRRATNIRRMGHAGTLDPFATGLLVICTGRATRIMPHLEQPLKTYVAVMQLGICTNTGDTEGEVTDKADVGPLSLKDFEALTPQVLAITSQVPPAYSAVKIDGKAAYKLARKGKEVKLEPKPVTIHSFTPISYANNQLTYRVVVSRGTYIRVLSQTIGQMLNLPATTVQLRREASGKLHVQQATELDKITEQTWQQLAHDPIDALTDMPHLNLAKAELGSFLNGNRVQAAGLADGPVAVTTASGVLAGVGICQNGFVQPKSVILPGDAC